jgi:cytoskeletal protein CcmA (bactofilin family)
MAMFDKHKSSKQPPAREEEPMVSRPAPQAGTPSVSGNSKVAMIGEGISVAGDVTANSNLKVEGRIEGSAVTSSHDIEVAESGIVLASITAREVKIAGAVSGDITGSEKVLISKSGRVQGNITAPRVQLEDGALFRGSIEMNPKEAAGANKPAPAAKPAGNDARPASGSSDSKSAQSNDSRKEANLTLKSG